MIIFNDLEIAGGAGLRHVLEDSITILRKDPSVGVKRKNLVIKILMSLFDEASEVTRQRSEYKDTFLPISSNAVRSFTFIENHLSERKLPELSGQLQTVLKVLRSIQKDQHVKLTDRNEAEELLSEVLESLTFQGDRIFPEEPEEIVWKE